MPARQLTVVLALALVSPVLSGCVRTDDGTLLWSENTVPLRMTSAMDPATYSPRIRERRERERVVSDFPAAPRVRDTRWRPREDRAPRIAPVRVVEPPFRPATSNNGLTCRNETTPSGRVKVVCD